MKKTNQIILFIIIISFLSSCKETTQVKKENDSEGKKNEISIVIENELWNSAIGDSIRKQILKSPLDYIETESSFDLKQYSPRIFKEEGRKSRNIIYFSKGIDTFQYTRDKYAAPQNLFTISASTTKKIVESINKHADSIINTVKKTEKIEEKQKLKKKPLHLQKNFETLFGINMQLPLEYQLSMYSDEPFLWYQKTIPSGDLNIVIFEIPYKALSKSDKIADVFVKAQDSVGKNFIQGIKENTYLQTQQILKIKEHTYEEAILEVYKIRGLWKMKNDILKGMFISYMFKDDYYSRFLIVSGIINTPNKPHRDVIIEIDAIFQTVDFYQTHL